MTNEKRNIRETEKKKRFLRRLVIGFENLRLWKYGKFVGLGFLIFTITTWAFRYSLEEFDWNTPDIVYYATSAKWVVIYILIAAALCYIASCPIKARSIENALVEAGITNAIGLPPMFERESGDEIAFRSTGIPVEEWVEHRERLENGLNLHISTIEQGRNNQEIVLKATSGDIRMPDKIPWRNQFSVDSPYLLICGESYGEQVTVSLRDTPHILLAGSTGSGKSWLLKLLLMQLVENGANVTIADFKGGIDFGAYWDENTMLITDIEATIKYLTGLVKEELPKRKELLKSNGCKDIDEYNTVADSPLPRLIFASDEVAELLDKTGASKEQKDRIAIIESCLATIARLGRAVGIHLILSMQRPDANILNGQIKNNIDARICGKCEDTLSMIVLDNTDASRRIPKSSHGVFLNQDKVMFKAYILPERYK